MKRFYLALGFAAALASPLFAADQTLVVIGWNAESGDSDTGTVGNVMKAVDGCDIWGMCEIESAAVTTALEAAAEDGESADFKSFTGTTGTSSNPDDLMAIIYDDDRFDLLKSYELHRINVTGTVRAPLVGHFKISGTDIEFLFVVNHLYRSRAFRRHEQARLLNRWATEQTLPIIAVGDYNFDWDVHQGDFIRDKGYDEMVAEGHFNWIQPRTLMKTQASPDYDTVLDFVFLGGKGCWKWKAESEILMRDSADTDPDNFDDDGNKSDHRPVKAEFTIPE